VATSAVDGEVFRGMVLVIEDETSVRSALKQVLTSRGIEVIGVATASDAAALIKQQDLCPDIVLCDYNLPGPINGVECVKSLRAALPWNPPAIVMTGDTRSKTMEVVASHGMSILVKPFLANELIQLINRLYHSSESARRNRSARLIAQQPPVS
jgi:DNA-binding response OmpR family regulator